MTTLTLKLPDLGQLAMYQQDGLELFISDSGAVYASQSAMARMLGMQQGHLSSVLKQPILPNCKEKEVGYKLKLPSASGIREQTLYGVSTIITLASRFNPSLATRFAEMGATVYLYKLAGYEVNPKVPISTTAASKLSDHDVLKTAYEAMGKLVAINTFVADIPGMKAYLELAQNPDSNLVHGMMTIEDMANHLGYDMSNENSRRIGLAMAGLSRGHNGEHKISITRKRFKDKSGNHQSYNVFEYSTSVLVFFEQLCVAYGVPKEAP